MKAYRIGRKPIGLWLNLTPPVRGGTYETHDTPTPPASEDLTDTEEDIADDTASEASDRSSASSFTSSEGRSVSSIERKAQTVLEAQLRERVSTRRHATPEDALRHESAFPAFIDADMLVRQECDRDICDYPSLDPAVQQDITQKYRALHQKVQDEGYYDCPYLEYGKEMVRYVALFAIFIVALRHGWYITSAAFLGLFWVRHPPWPVPRRAY